MLEEETLLSSSFLSFLKGRGRTQVDDAKAARKAAAIRVSLSANTLASANALAAEARASKTAARAERSTSEKREAQVDPKLVY